MKKITYALFFVILAIVLLTFVSCSDFGTFSYRLDEDGNALITNYNDIAFSGYERLEIPAEIDGHRVVGIYELGLAGAKVSDVVFPEGILSIDSAIFYNAKVTGNVYIPASVTDIADDAFSFLPKEGPGGKYIFNPRMQIQSFVVNEENEHYSSKDGVLYSKDGTVLMHYPNAKPSDNFEIPDGTITIDYEAFVRADNLKRITVSDSVECIDAYAFSSMASLEQVDIGSGVSEILSAENGYAWSGYSVFSSSGALREINVDENNAVFSSIDGNLYSKDGTVLIAYAQGNERRAFTVPDSVVSIERGAFHETEKLVSLTLSPSIREIGEEIICNCESIAELIIPNGPTKVKGSAFSICPSLEYVYFPDSVEYVGSYTFSRCESLSKVSFGKNVSEIHPQFVSGDNSLYEITVSSENMHYKSLDGNLYSKDGKILIRYAVGKSDKKFSVPTSVETIGKYAFYGADDLQDIVIPESVRVIEENAFRFVDFDYIILENPDGWFCVNYRNGEREPLDRDEISLKWKCAKIFRRNHLSRFERVG